MRICSAPRCAIPVPHGRSRCPTHTVNTPHQRTRSQRGYTNDWLRLSRQAIADQPWCTRCGATSDLTADHITPLVEGGVSERENVTVLCRRCNSAKGGRS